MDADELAAWIRLRRTHRTAWGHPHPKPAAQQPQPQEKR